MAVPDHQQEIRHAQYEATSSANVTGGATIESQTRDAGGYAGQSMHDGGTGGVAAPDDVAGVRSAQITASNVAGSTDGGDMTYAASRAGVDVDTNVPSPTSEIGDPSVREFHARNDAAAQANVVTDRTDKAEAVYRAPSEHAEAEGRARLRSEAADRTPDAAVEVEAGVDTAKEARTVASNPEQAGKDALRDIADEKKANVQADVGINVTTKKPDGSGS